MDERARVDAADRSLWEAWTVIARSNPSGAVAEEGPALLLSTGIKLAFFNSMTVRAPLADPAVVIDKATAFFAEREVPWLLRVRAGIDERTERAAADAGFEAAQSMPAFTLAPIPSPPPPPAGVTIREMRPDEGRIYADVSGAGFGLPEHLSRALNEPLVGTPDVVHFMALLDGEPVATSLLHVTGEVGGIYNVATPKPYRRRGIGEAVTWAAVAEAARRGCTVATLQASPMGRPIYERMGFTFTCDYLQFAPPGVSVEGA